MLSLIKKTAVAACVLILGFGIYLGGCNKLSTKPPQPGPGEHLFYISTRLAGDRSLVKTFSVDQQAFIDSFIIDSFQLTRMSVIGDDEELYVGSQNEGVRFYDIKIRELLYSTVECCCGAQTSANSEYYYAYADGLRLFRTENHQEIYYDGAATASGNFSFDSKYYLYARFDTVVAYNLSGDSIENSFSLTRNGLPFRIYKIWPTINMAKLYLVGNQGQLLYFAVTDFGKDSVRVLQAPLRTWGEDAKLSPDGRCLYFVNTPYTDIEIPRKRVDVYDVDTEQLITSISTAEYYFEPQQIALTSDGKYIMATPWILGGVDVLLIDAQNFGVIGSYEFGDQIVAETVCTKH